MRDGSSSPRYRSAAGRVPDVAIISLGTTIGLRYADEALAELVREAGASCLVRPVELGQLAFLRRSMLLTDAVESYAARRAVTRDVDAVAYAANPGKRGLELLCGAWRDVAPVESRLHVGGLEPAAARRYLSRARVVEPDTVVWVGVLPRARWLDLVARAR